MSEAADFLKLCKALRKLGATKVAAHGFEAEFRTPAQPMQQTVLPFAQAPRRVLRPAPVPERLTPEQLNEAKEAAFARELGLT